MAEDTWTFDTLVFRKCNPCSSSQTAQMARLPLCGAEYFYLNTGFHCDDDCYRVEGGSNTRRSKAEGGVATHGRSFRNLRNQFVHLREQCTKKPRYREPSDRLRLSSSCRAMASTIYLSSCSSFQSCVFDNHSGLRVNNRPLPTTKPKQCLPIPKSFQCQDGRRQLAAPNSYLLSSSSPLPQPVQ